MCGLNSIKKGFGKYHLKNKNIYVLIKEIYHQTIASLNNYHNLYAV